MFRHLSTVLTSLTLAAVAITLNCGPVKNAGHAVIDCLSADRAKIDALLADLGTKTRADGTHDWAAVEADAIAAGATIGGCALAEFIEGYLTPATGVKAPADGAQARDALEQFRSGQAGGATFKTRLGDL